jgi:hypothetical protein
VTALPENNCSQRLSVTCCKVRSASRPTSFRFATSTAAPACCTTARPFDLLLQFRIIDHRQLLVFLHVIADVGLDLRNVSGILGVKIGCKDEKRPADVRFVPSTLEKSRHTWR